MAMPASGSIAIISAPQTCGSICAAVGVASGSLSTLSVAAGKTAPHCMREFYGYNPATEINLIQYAGTGTQGIDAHITRCFCVDPLPMGAESYTICICGYLSTLSQQIFSCAQICVVCGATQKLCACCVAGSAPPVTTSTSFLSSSVNKVCILLDACARDVSCPLCSSAKACIFSISGTGYEKGTTCTLGAASTG